MSPREQDSAGVFLRNFKLKTSNFKLWWPSASSLLSQPQAGFTIALKEARETQYWLRLIIATELARKVSLAAVLQEASELVAILTVARRNMGELEGKKGTKGRPPRVASYPRRT